MTRREKVLSVTLLLIIWFGVGYRFWHQPLVQQIQAVEQQITAAESEVRPAEIKAWSSADQLAGPAEKNRFKDYEVTQTEQEKQIPKQRAFPELLEQLVAWADESGVRLAGFKVEPENTENTGNAQKANNTQKVNNAENTVNADNKGAGIRVIQVHARIEGPYVQVIAFLVKLEQAERLMRVDQLELSQNDRTESSGSASVSPSSAFPESEETFNPNLQAQISFSIYYLPD